MNTSTRWALVLLRIAIGWHFLFEGVAKLETHFTGPTTSKPLWTSEPYLRGATGPFADTIRAPLGDLDADALERLTLPETKPGEPAKLPPALEKEWDAEFQRFVDFYKVGTDKAPPLKFIVPFTVAEPDKLQLALAKALFAHARLETLHWLESGVKEVDKQFSKVEEKVPVTTQQRIDAYKKQLRDARRLENEGNPAFGHNVYKKTLTDLKKDSTTSRKELLADENRPFKDALKYIQAKVLTDEQRKLGTPPEPEPGFRWITWIDRVTMWGLVIVGGCLLLGLFTRTACVLGALFLTMLYLSMPPWPWLPQDPSTARSHFFFVNMNVIEALALLTLATTASGKWLGLDGLVQFLNPWSYKKPAAPKQPVPPTSHNGGPVGPRLPERQPVVTTTPAQEPPHGP